MNNYYVVAMATVLTMMFCQIVMQIDKEQTIRIKIPPLLILRCEFVLWPIH
jgi:hypothetical protein